MNLVSAPNSVSQSRTTFAVISAPLSDRMWPYDFTALASAGQGVRAFGTYRRHPENQATHAVRSVVSWRLSRVKNRADELPLYSGKKVTTYLSCLFKIPFSYHCGQRKYVTDISGRPEYSRVILFSLSNLRLNSTFSTATSVAHFIANFVTRPSCLRVMMLHTAFFPVIRFCSMMSPLPYKSAFFAIAIFPLLFTNTLSHAFSSLAQVPVRSAAYKARPPTIQPTMTTEIAIRIRKMLSGLSLK